MTSYILDNRPLTEGFDTETYLGYAYLISSSSSYAIHTQPEPLTTLESLDFICRQFTGMGKNMKIGFFFNIAFDFGAIIKQWIILQSQSVRNDFRETGIINVGPYELFYIPGKALIMKRQDYHRRINLYDIGNLLRGKEGYTLEKLARLYLGRTKLGGVDKPRLAKDLNYWRSHRSRIIEYCRRDAMLTRNLADLFLDNVNGALGFYPRFYHSKASMSKAWINQTHPYLRKQFMCVARRRDGGLTWTSKLPLTVPDLKLIFNTFWGGIIDTWIFGRIEDVSTVDINSAYPYAISRLPKLDVLEIRRGKEYSADAVTGFYKVHMPYTNEYPLPYRDRQTVIYPNGKGELCKGEMFETIYPENERNMTQYMTKIKLDFLKNQGCVFHVKEAVEFFWGKRSDPPLEFPDILELYEKRQWMKCHNNNPVLKAARTNQLREYMLKIVMNAMYGSMAELKNGLGPFTNLAWASMITASTHVQIYKLIDQIGRDNIVSIATDGILFKDVDQDLRNDDGSMLHIRPTEIGHYRKETEKVTAYVYQNGVYFLKKPGVRKAIEFRYRGMPTLTPGHLLKAKGHTVKTMYERPLHLFELLAYADTNPKAMKQLNIWHKMTRVLDLRQNQRKRILGCEPKFETFNSREVPSEPLMVSGNYKLKPFPEPSLRPCEIAIDLKINSEAER